MSILLNSMKCVVSGFIWREHEELLPNIWNTNLIIYLPGFAFSILMSLSNKCWSWFPSLTLRHSRFLCPHPCDTVILSCASARSLSLQSGPVCPPHTPCSGRKGGGFLFRVKGSDNSGTGAGLALEWVSVWLISFPFQLFTWASVQKIKLLVSAICFILTK